MLAHTLLCFAHLQAKATFSLTTPTRTDLHRGKSESSNDVPLEKPNKRPTFTRTNPNNPFQVFNSDNDDAEGFPHTSIRDGCSKPTNTSTPKWVRFLYHSACSSSRRWVMEKGGIEAPLPARDVLTGRGTQTVLSGLSFFVLPQPEGVLSSLTSIAGQ